MFKTGQVVYGFAPGIRDNNYIPIVTAFHYNYTDRYGTAWPVPSEAYYYGLCSTHVRAYDEKYVFATREECIAARDEYYENWLAEQQLTDEEWAEKEAREYLGRYFDEQTVDKYIAQLKAQYDELYEADIRIYEGKVWAKLFNHVPPCSPIVEDYWHKETKAEKEERLKRQRKYNIEKFGKVYKEVVI